MLNDSTIQELLAAAVFAAKQAGSLVSECITKKRAGCLSTTVETKASAVDFVTEYDKKCDELIMAMLHESTIKAGVTNFAFLTEESKPDEEVGDVPTWIVDPIDGTTSFMHGSFDCCISIGLTIGKKPVLGVVWVPLMQELFTAVKGRGAFFNGEPILNKNKTRQPKKFNEGCLVGYHLPAQRVANKVDASLAIVRDLLMSEENMCHSVRCYGSAALDCCSVALGRMDCYFELGISAWDICAGCLIVTESGGFAGGILPGEPCEEMRRGKMGIVVAATAELGASAQELSTKHGLTPEKILA